MANVKPLGDRVLIKPLDGEERTKSGLVIPDTAKEKPQQGTVVAVGTGRTLESGEKVALEVQEGQTILFSKYAGTEIKLDGVEHLILSERDILAIME